MVDLQERLDIHPVIAAIKDETALGTAMRSPCEVIFLLTGNICSIESTVEQVRTAGKMVYIHIDLMEGFGRDKYSIMYIKERIRPDGILTTRSNLVKISKELGMSTIQRLFLVDNLSIESGIQSVRQGKPDAVEIMPGLMPTITKKLCGALSVPVITGGLINEKESIIASLGAGAVGISTSKQELWDL